MRTKVADACLDYGLLCIQWSAFIGELTMTLQRELMLRARTIIRDHAANILIVPLNAATWSQRRELLQGDPDAERAPKDA